VSQDSVPNIKTEPFIDILFNLLLYDSLNPLLVPVPLLLNSTQRWLDVLLMMA